MKRILRAIPAAYGVMVAVTLYVAGGGRHPLILDLWVVGIAGLVTYIGLRQLVDQALADRKDNP